ncbi:MAG: LysR family transcriptional regulator [Myxococcota bacterium]
MSLDLGALAVFVKVAELGSFTRAAEQLSISKARASLQVRSLEAALGGRLLQRTTRAVRPTVDGEQLLPRARQLLLEAEEVEAVFRGGSARGPVRIDLPVRLARDVVIPRLPQLLEAHPGLEVLLSATDRRVEVIKEGFDCVLSVGALRPSGLVAQRIGWLSMVNCASPSYLGVHGVPRTLDDLDHHLLVHYAGTLGAEPPGFEFPDGAGGWRERPMRARLTVNNADAFHAACLAGLGLAQAPRMGLTAPLADGRLVEVLPDHRAQPMPVSLVHPHGRRVPGRVRWVLDWLASIVGPELI